MERSGLLSPFECFDPLKGVPKHHFFDQADLITNRARIFLHGRSREEIIYMVETINYMFVYRDPMRQALDHLDDEEEFDWDKFHQKFNQPATYEPTLGQTSGLPGKGLKANPDWWFASPATALRGCTELFDISDQDNLPEVKWSEYFAALTLALVGESQQIPAWILNENESDEVRRDLSASQYVASGLIDAMEALGKTELFQEQESHDTAFEEATKQKIKLRGQKGGIKRHSETNKTKLDFIRWLEDCYISSLPPNTRFNRTESAREYYEEFLEDDAPSVDEGPDASIKHKSNWIRTLTTALRDYEKTGKLPKLPKDKT